MKGEIFIIIISLVLLLLSLFILTMEFGIEGFFVFLAGIIIGFIIFSLLKLYDD